MEVLFGIIGLGVIIGWLRVVSKYENANGGSKSNRSNNSNIRRNTSLTKADYGRMGAKLGRSMARSMCRMKW